MVYLLSPARRYYPPSLPRHPRRTRHHSIRPSPRPLLGRCHARLRQAHSQTCRVFSTLTSAPPPSTATLSCPPVRRQRSTASCVLEPRRKVLRMDAGAISRFRYAHSHRPTVTVCLHGHGLDVWRRMIRVSPGKQAEMTRGACIGRLWQNVDAWVRAVMKLNAIAATMMIRSTSHHRKLRTRMSAPRFL